MAAKQRLSELRAEQHDRTPLPLELLQTVQAEARRMLASEVAAAALFRPRGEPLDGAADLAADRWREKHPGMSRLLEIDLIGSER